MEASKKTIRNAQRRLQKLEKKGFAVSALLLAPYTLAFYFQSHEPAADSQDWHVRKRSPRLDNIAGACLLHSDGNLANEETVSSLLYPLLRFIEYSFPSATVATTPSASSLVFKSPLGRPSDFQYMYISLPTNFCSAWLNVTLSPDRSIYK